VVIDAQTAMVFALTLAAGLFMARLGISLHILVRRPPRRCAACGRTMTARTCPCFER
jgi:hypothetical protein